MQLVIIPVGILFPDGLILKLVFLFFFLILCDFPCKLLQIFHLKQKWKYNIK